MQAIVEFLINNRVKKSPVVNDLKIKVDRKHEKLAQDICDMFDFNSEEGTCKDDDKLYELCVNNYWNIYYFQGIVKKEFPKYKKDPNFEYILGTYYIATNCGSEEWDDEAIPFS